MLHLKGMPIAIGRAYGERYRNRILANLKILVHRVGYSPLPRQKREFVAWMHHQESLLGKHWPWLLEEMRGVAHGVGVEYADILLLNLRAWQFEYYGAKPKTNGCSSLAITLADGTVACGGALDDPPDYYCGPVHFQPATGYAFITFPIAGTSWGNRGQNSRGLALGISSLVLPDLPPLDQAVNQDLACRAILQTCATTDEVREFCQAHPFTMSLVVVDARGEIFCAQNTVAGLFEMPVDGYCGLTNHVADERLRGMLQQRGGPSRPEDPTTIPRRQCLLEFAEARNEKCTFAEVMDFIGRRDVNNPGTIHNSGSIYLTASTPQGAARTFWIRQTQFTGHKAEFIPQTIG